MKRALILIATTVITTAGNLGVLFNPANNNLLTPTNPAVVNLTVSNNIVNTNLSSFIDGVTQYISTNVSAGSTTGLGLTNNGGVLSNNIVGGTAISISAGANGQLTINNAGAAIPTGAAGQVILYTNSSASPIAGNIGDRIGYYGAGSPLRIISEGDSMSAAYVVTATNTPIGRLFNNHIQSNWVYGTNAATAGTTIDQHIADYATQVYPLRPASGTNAVLIYWGGVNNLIAGESAATVFGKWSNYVSTAKVDGFKVLAITAGALADAGLGETFEFQRLQFNKLLRDSKLANWIYDEALDIPPPPNSAIYFETGNPASTRIIHLNAIANAIVASGINEVLQRGLGNNYPPNAQLSPTFITEQNLRFNSSGYTYGNATTTYHGLAPVLSGYGAEYLDGNGAYTRPGQLQTSAPTVATRLIFEGDEQTLGDGGTNSLLARFNVWKTSGNWVTTNIAVSGQKIEQAYTTNFVAYITPLAPSGGTNAVISYQIGINDVKASMTPEQFMTDWEFFLDVAHGINFKVCAYTIPPSADLTSQQEFNRQQINTRIRKSSRWDWLYDIDNDFPAPPDFWFYNESNLSWSSFARDRAGEALAKLLESPKGSRYPWSPVKKGGSSLGSITRRGLLASTHGLNTVAAGFLYEISGSDTWAMSNDGAGVEGWFHTGVGNVNTTTEKYFGLTASSYSIYNRPLLLQDLAGDPGTPANGMLWNNAGTIKARSGGVTISFGQRYRQVGVAIPGNGSVIGSGYQGNPVTLGPVTGTIVAATIIGSPSGSISVDVWKKNAANPAAADKISASAPIALTAETYHKFTSFGTWSTTAVAADDVWGFSAQASPATVTNVVVVLTIQQ